MRCTDVVPSTERISFLPSATKLRRLCFYRHVSTQGGVSASVHAGIPPPGADTHPPQSRPPQEQTPPPGSKYPPPRSDTPPPKFFSFFLHFFCILFTPPPIQDTATAADGTHPTGMHSCYDNVMRIFVVLSCPVIPLFRTCRSCRV